MSLLPAVRRIAGQYGFAFSRSLSQNFLVDERVLAREVEYAAPAGRTVLEIGPGFGFLTRMLAAAGAKSVVAVEKDADLIPILGAELAGCKNVEVVHADFLELRPPPPADVVVSNVPYSISSPLLFALADMAPSRAVLCLQREFVARMKAPPGSREYSRLSLSAQAAFRFEGVERVPAGAFYPRPAVDSAIVSLAPTGSPLSEPESRIASLLFMHKKKTVRSALADSAEALGMGKDGVRRAAEESGLAQRRVFTLVRQDVNRIALQIARA